MASDPAPQRIERQRGPKWVLTIALPLSACGRGGSGAPVVVDADLAPVAVVAPAIDAAPWSDPVATDVTAARCEDARDVYLFVSPRTPRAGAPLRVMAVTDRPMGAELTLARVEKGSDAGVPVLSTAARRGATPYFWTAEVDSARGGNYKLTLTQPACTPGEGSTTRTLAVVHDAPATPATPDPEDPLWHVRNAWSHHLEQVYSAWIEALFDAPEGEMPSWHALHEIVRDPKHNFLFDYLGLGEDSVSPPLMRPDCADLPYFLRAYFAMKLGLPFAIGHCKPGGGGVPPSCDATMLTNEDPAPPMRDAGASENSRFEAFLKVTVADHAHSSSARQPFDEQNSDYYPVPLTWESLRPGTVYADPYGHVLVLAKRIPQTAEHGGVLYAVDAQPDGTVARKRYWRGNFLYATEPELGGPGFKRFRPIVRDKRADAGEDALVRPDDDAIRENHEYADVSREAAGLSVEAFYDRIDTVLSPRPLDPERAMLETLGALEEQVRTRVQSVDNGRKWLEGAPPPAPMPEGGEIFETVGPWEDFSTPSRDLRILIAIDVVRGFPARVAKRPERYAMSGAAGQSGPAVAADLEKLLARELRSRKVTYTRTDGSPFELSLATVIEREAALEVAYNPNDCVETRWGAPPGSEEAKTCHAEAPPDQRERMETYRTYFHERKRPARK